MRRGFSWFVVVVGSSSPAFAQVTVSEEPQQPAAAAAANTPLRQAAREQRSISLSEQSLGGPVPEFHTVERGDTLWDITGYYFQNPYRWPSVWGLNPQITNPHWIFPGDRVRLLTPEEAGPQPAQPGIRPTATPGAPVSPARAVQPATVFLRDQGWLDRQEAQAAGTIVGSPEDSMLLAENDQAYVEFPSRTPRVGEEYTIYSDTEQNLAGAQGGTGHVVRVLGTMRVDNWDRDRHTATATITESLEPIERGARVAAIPRRLETVPPARNEVNLRASIVSLVQPRQLVGQHMVVFLDKGSDDHVRPGNRLFVVRRGDPWRQSLTTSESHAAGAGLDRDGDGVPDQAPPAGRADESLPEEVVGEVLVVDVRPHSATGLVTSSVVDLRAGDALEMREGY